MTTYTPCNTPCIGVIILNYKNWMDTITCAESVLASNVPPAWIVIVDNASPDDSAFWIRHWAAGHLDSVLCELIPHKTFVKPLSFCEVDEKASIFGVPIGQVILLRCHKNRGYAAGNNAGIRLLMSSGADAIWILNNDTVVEQNALGAMYQCLSSKRHPGLCGSLICYQGTNYVQCRAGGFYNHLTSLSILNGHMEDISTAKCVEAKEVEKSINFIYGASVMASRHFIEKAGLMDERYFLYCEEQDWAYSGAKYGFDLAYAPDAVVWHKEGTTTGLFSSNFNARRLYTLTRSRLLLTAKYYPLALPSVCLSIVFAAFRRTWRRLLKKG